MTGINDVAAATGVSTATVSRSLRGLPGVSATTRERVLEAAARLGYVPSPQAAGLASGSTRTIAIVVPYLTRWYFAEVVEAAERVLRAAGYDVLLYSLGGDPAVRHRVLEQHVLGKRVDAVVVVGMQPSPSEVAALERLGRPVVTLGISTAQWPSILIDDYEVTRVAVHHLHELGHRDIAYIGGLHNNGLDFATPLARLAGYRDALGSFGLARRADRELEGHFTPEGGEAAGVVLIGLRPRPTAVVCASDEMAFGVLGAARDAGVRVPGDLAVVGVDDHPLARFVDLSTVRQPVRLQGEMAARTVLARLADPTAEVPPPVVVRTALVRRGTSGPPSGPPGMSSLSGAATTAGSTSPSDTPM